MIRHGRGVKAEANRGDTDWSIGVYHSSSGFVCRNFGWALCSFFLGPSFQKKAHREFHDGPYLLHIRNQNLSSGSTLA